MTRLVPSNSEADVLHRVETSVVKGVEHAFKCDCRSYQFRGNCKHVEAVNENPSLYEAASSFSGVTISQPQGVKSSLRKPLPMLAHVFDATKVSLAAGRYAVEEKFDGHRLVVEVRESTLTAWSRTGKDSMSKLSAKMKTELLLLPDGIYDGEIMSTKDGGRSYDVSHLQANSLVYVIFDVLSNRDYDITGTPYSERRSWLEKCFGGRPFEHVVMAKSWVANSQEELDAAVQEIWEAGGEGVIVKDRKGVYSAGTSTNKRSRAFLKIKQCQHATMKIIGFAATEGTIMNRGSYAVAVLEDGAGIYTLVKVLDNAQLDRLNAAMTKSPQLTTIRMSSGKKVEVCINHPFVGRKLLIEYHEQTPDGNYRHARWDRYSDE